MAARIAIIMLFVSSLLSCPVPALAGGDTFIAKPAPRSVILSGFTRAVSSVDLVAEEPGRVLKVMADVGQAVGRAGRFTCLDDVYVRLDIKANKVERGRLASRIAHLDRETGRYRTLVARGTAPQSVLDALEQDLDQARHQLAAAEVAGGVLKERLKRMCVPAPAGWLVSKRLIEPGQWVAAGQVVGRAGDYSRMLVPLALAPDEFAAMDKSRGGLSLELPDLGTTVPARIYRISPAFDPATRKIGVELAVSGGATGMRGGLRAVLTLAVPDGSGAVLAPASAVAERFDAFWLARADGTEVRVVVLGDAPGGMKRVAGPGVAPGQSFLREPGDRP